MGEDDILIMMGDHGMSAEGHHGGNSNEEINTVIFGYSKKGFFNAHPEIKNFDPSYKLFTN